MMMKKIACFLMVAFVVMASSFASPKVEILIDKYVESYEAGFYCTKPYEHDGQMAVVCTHPKYCEQRVLSFKDSTTAYCFCQAYKATCRSLSSSNIEETMASLDDLFCMLKFDGAEIVGYYSMFDGYLIVAYYNVEEK